MTTLADILPEPSFIDRDGNAVITDMINAWEHAVGKPLYPAQVERLLINLAGYREMLLRMGIQDAAKLNLVAYSRFPMLDLLGQLVGVMRLPPVAATCQLRFTLSELSDTPIPISAGTRVDTPTADHEFRTVRDAVIQPGEWHVTVPAQAAASGADHNGVPINSLTEFVIPLRLNESIGVQNIDTTAGGMDTEPDERLRFRIFLSPERYSSAGPVNAYRYHVYTVSQDIAYCGMLSPSPGRVNIYPLLKTGLPSETILALVRKVLMDDRVRPLTDWVEVHSPVRVPYTVTLYVKTLKGAQADLVFAAVEASVAAFADALRAVTGHDLVGSQWIERIQSVKGVYSCRLQGFVDQVLDESQWPDCEGFVVMNDGVATNDILPDAYDTN